MLKTLSLESTLKHGSLKRLSRSGTAENPAQANIQGVEINLVKKTIKGRCYTRQEVGVNIIGGEAVSLTNPKKGCTDTCKINIQTVRGRIDR